VAHRPPRRESRDFLSRILKLEEYVRRLRDVSKAHTESKTLIIPASAGTIDDTTDLPPFGVRVNADGKSSEWKQVVGFGGAVGSGSVTVEWQLDGTPIGLFSALDTGWSTTPLTTPVDLEYDHTTNGAHTFKAVVQSGSSAVGGVSLEVIVATGRR
jgi:hypothetical protein